MNLSILFHKHYWFPYDRLIFEGVYLAFQQPLGEAKIEYCAYCGTIRFVGLAHKRGKK